MECLTGTIIPWAGTYVPEGWVYCNGQLLSTVQYQALFAIIGNKFGGSLAQKTFALPNLCGLSMVGSGQEYTWGQTGGVEQVTLTQATMAVHNHTLQGNSNSKTSGSNTPDATRVLGTSTTSGLKPVPIPMYNVYTNNQGDLTNFSPASITPTGATAVALHSNLQPYLALNYIICLNGMFPVHWS